MTPLKVNSLEVKPMTLNEVNKRIELIEEKMTEDIEAMGTPNKFDLLDWEYFLAILRNMKREEKNENNKRTN